MSAAKNLPTPDAVVADTQRWLQRVVIGLNLCPFAKSVFVKQQIRYVVSTASTPETLLSELTDELLLLAQTNPDEIDTTLLIHPFVLQDFHDYNAFLGQAERRLRKARLAGVLQIASFHPQYQFAGTDADDISNCTNRSPWPMLHLLREASVDRAVAAFPEASRIYEKNIATLNRLGRAGWQRLNEPGQPDDTGG